MRLSAPQKQPMPRTMLCACGIGSAGASAVGAQPHTASVEAMMNRAGKDGRMRPPGRCQDTGNTWDRTGRGQVPVRPATGAAGRVSGGLPAGALAVVLGEELLAQADGLRRDLDQFVVVDEFQRLLQAEAQRRRQQQVVILAGG